MTDNSSLDQPTVSSHRIYEGKILNLRVDTIRLPSGRPATREVVEHVNSVCIVPVDGEGNVLLVSQYRTPTGKVLLEAPAGGLDEAEAPEAAVLRELQEETGFTAGTLRHLCSFWLAPGWCDEFMHAYLATELSMARLEPDEDEIINVSSVPLSEIPGLIASGEIQDAKSIAALLLAIDQLNNGQ